MCVQYMLTSTLMEFQSESVSYLHPCSWLTEEACSLIPLGTVLEWVVSHSADMVSRSADAEFGTNSFC